MRKQIPRVEKFVPRRLGDGELDPIALRRERHDPRARRTQDHHSLERLRVQPSARSAFSAKPVAYSGESRVCDSQDKPGGPMHRVVRMSAVVLALACAPAVSGLLAIRPVLAQEQEKFTNLKVFPKDISPQELRSTMSTFTRALGVRCNFCHALPE